MIDEEGWRITAKWQRAYFWGDKQDFKFTRSAGYRPVTILKTIDS